VPSISNDAFSGRSRLVGTEGREDRDNHGAGREPGEPLHAGQIGGHSLWWRWDAEADGEVRIDTDGSEVDTLLAVYTGSGLPNLQPVVSNDDHGLGVTSRVRFVVTRGVSYAIAIDSMGSEARSAEGRIVLRWSFVSEPIARPANDRFTDRFRLPDGAVPFRVEASNREATREAGEPIHAQVMGDSSVWWEWKATSSEPVLLSTEGSDFDTVVAVYVGDSIGALVPIVFGDDIDSPSGVLTSAVSWVPEAGRRYQIAIDGFDGASGKVRLALAPWVPQLMDLQRTPDDLLRFRVPGLPGTTQTLECSTDPRCCWSPVPDWQVTGGFGNYLERIDEEASQRFYRVISRP
jgi:hypothetical protein